MSVNADLASWGEPTATPAESAMGVLLDEWVTQLDRGDAVAVETVPEGGELVEAVRLLHQCATSVWEQSGLIPCAAAAPRLPDPFPGEFRLCREIGAGAFGKVWLADDLQLGRPVAIKTLKLPATATAGPTLLAALRKEAQHLARLRHPNIVQVHAWREAGGESFLIMQYVAGGSLADRLRAHGPLPWQLAARYIADVSEGLRQAHALGIIHRDIKPANILWDASSDEALLTDFGVAALLAEPDAPAGTPVYMAPEAFSGQVTAALDVYSLTATLFHLITGEVPFGPAPIPSLIAQAHLGLPDADPRCAALPEPLERIVRAGLAAAPERRPTLATFLASLRAALNQLLADALLPTDDTTSSPVDLRLMVSRQAGRQAMAEMAQTPAPRFRSLRDMHKVPRAPDQVRLHTGDLVRIEVAADRDGHVTVFNVGPTGNLNLLYPDEPAAAGRAQIQRGRPLHVVDVEMVPPAGRERLFAVWSRRPLLLHAEQLRGLAEESEAPGSRPYRATRDMKRIEESVRALPAEDRQVVVLELDHLENDR